MNMEQVVRSTEISVEHTRQGLVINYDGNGFEVMEAPVQEFHLSFDGLYELHILMAGDGGYMLNFKKAEVDLVEDGVATDWDELEAENKEAEKAFLEQLGRDEKTEMYRCPNCGAGEEYLEQYDSILSTSNDLFLCHRCDTRFSIAIVE
jgi:hypothetical protein